MAFLVALGLVMVFSSSSAIAYSYHHDTAYFLKRQVVYLIVGLALAYAAYRVDYRKLRAIAPGLVLVTFVLLVLTLIPHVGYATGGARRWIGMRAISFQPSELGKLALVIFLAAKLSQLGENVRSLSKGVGPALFVTLLLAAPVFVEPDMGTASLYIFTAFALLFTAGARFEHLIMCALVMLPAAAIAIGSSAYKRARIFAFLDPWKDAQNTGYHIVQSLLALGSGGLVGPGPGRIAPEILLPARSLHRLHLRGARRRARPPRLHRGDRAVRAVRHPRGDARDQSPRPLRHAPRDGLHVHDRDPSLHQHRRGHIVLAGNGRPAPVHLLRRDLADRIANSSSPDSKRRTISDSLTKWMDLKESRLS